ncbi:MAG: hypothetical protein Q9193_001894 [Seirophora villosa]
MATVLPPPSKRQRTLVAEKAREQQDVDTIPSDLGSVRVHFYDQSTGKPTGAPVAIPVADATVKNLELLMPPNESPIASALELMAKSLT